MEKAEISHLAVEHASFLEYLSFVVVIDPKALEKKFILVRRHSALLHHQHPLHDSCESMEWAYLQLLFRIGVGHTTLQNHSPESSIVEVIDMTCMLWIRKPNPRRQMKENSQSTCLQLI